VASLRGRAELRAIVLDRLAADASMIERNSIAEQHPDLTPAELDFCEEYLIEEIRRLRERVRSRRG